jgi:hypothetical protein
MSTQFRQGDVFLVKVDQLPPEAVKQESDGRVVLAYGEVTGHAHAISAACATLYEHGQETILEVFEPTKLEHEEHSAIALEPGYYRVVRQQEYSPGTIRRVAD